MSVNLYQDLLENHTFIEWVNSDFEKHDDVWSTYIDENPTQYEVINQAIRSVLSLRGEKYVFAGKNDLFAKIETSIKANQGFKHQLKIFSLPRLVAYAASFLFLAMATLFFVSQTKVESIVGQQMVVILPDQSKVTLNTNSVVQYNTLLWNWQKKVKLTGEAFFEVKKGESFIVETTSGEVAVLGTSFNVESSDNIFEVFCFTGKVSVSSVQLADPVVLKPHDGIHIGKTKKPTLFHDSQSQLSPDWKNGREKIVNESFENAVVTVQKYFNEKIVVNEGLHKLKITADIPIHDLDTALQTITWPLGLQYKILDGKVEIFR